MTLDKNGSISSHPLFKYMTNDVAFRNAIIKIHTFQSSENFVVLWIWVETRKIYGFWGQCGKSVTKQRETDQRVAIYQAAVISLKKKTKITVNAADAVTWPESTFTPWNCLLIERERNKNLVHFLRFFFRYSIEVIDLWGIY